jgi:hypothetical protein
VQNEKMSFKFVIWPILSVHNATASFKQSIYIINREFSELVLEQLCHYPAKNDQERQKINTSVVFCTLVAKAVSSFLR